MFPRYNRTIRRYLIEIFRILKKFKISNAEKLFEMNDDKITRGHFMILRG